MILAIDKLKQIKDWLDYVQNELDNERIDLVELSQIDEVFKLTKEF
jgi:hypothetical protein